MAYQNRNETRLEQAAAILLFPSPPLAPSPIISLAFWQRERHLALGTDFCSLKKTQRWRRDVTLPGATVARTDFAQLMAAKRPTEWAGVQCWAGYHALLPSGQRVSRNYCAIV